MSKFKIACVAIVTVFALIAGLYLSGYLTLWWLGLDIPLAWNTWWKYFKALGHVSELQPFARKIQLSGLLGFGLPTAIWLFATVTLMRRPGSSSTCGGARFAYLSEIKKAGLITPAPYGVLVGKFRSRYLYKEGTQHILMTAPTRSGKSTSLVIPTLLTYRGSVVVADTKGELFQLTSGRRKALGQTIFKFDPYNERGITHRFNPFQALSPDSRVRIGELQSIAAILYPDDKAKDPFWTSMARKVFMAFALYMFDFWLFLLECRESNRTEAGYEERPMDSNTDVRHPSFERIYRLSTGESNEGGVKAWIQALLQSGDGACLSREARTYFSDLAGLAEETFSSALATMQEPLSQFLSPILAAATNASDFDLRHLRRKRMAIYVVIPPSKLGESSKLLNIFFSAALNANLDKTPDEDKSIKTQMLLVMDEFTAMGPLNSFADRISLIAGYWVRALTIIQSLSQLRATYGPDVAKTLMTNHALSIAYTPREQEDAEQYSRQLGEKIVIKRQRTDSRGVGGSSVSYAHIEERAPLMRPQELQEMSMDDQIIFSEGCKPIRCKKNWYFKDKNLNGLLLDPVEIPALAAPRTKGDPSDGR